MFMPRNTYGTKYLHASLIFLFYFNSSHAADTSAPKNSNTSNNNVSSFYDAELNEQSYILLSSELTISDNISQRETNRSSGYNSKNSAYLSYQLQRKKNKLSINYDTFYTIYSKNDIDNELYWFGTASLYQNLYFKQLYLSLIHQRNRYLLEPSGSSLPENQGDRDILTIKPIWTQQLSQRSNVQLSYSNTNINYSNNSNQDSQRNGIQITLNNKTSKFTSLKVSTAYDDVKFTDSNTGYEQSSASIGFHRELDYGSFLIEGGVSKITQDSQDTTSPTASVTYHYKKNKHSLGLILRKSLTDTSSGLGLSSTDNGDLNADIAEIIDRERAEAFYRYSILPNRLINSVRMYIDRENSEFTLNNTTIKNTDYQRGIANTLTLYHRPTFSSSFTVNFRRTDRENDSKHDKLEWQLSTSYQVSSPLLLTASFSYIENEDLNNSGSSYDELRFKTKVTFKY